MQLANLAAHLHPELCVQVRQRLVEQEHLRIAHDCPSHGDALPLSTGQLAWASIKKLPDTENRGGATDPRVAPVFFILLGTSENSIFSRTVICG